MSNLERGIVIGGEYGAILIRARNDVEIELGDLLVIDSENKSLLLQVYDLRFGSQISAESREFIAEIGLEIEGVQEFFSKGREYVIALAKEIATIDEDGGLISAKALPIMFSKVRGMTSTDLGFLSKPDNPLFLGHVRSGSKILDVEVYLDAVDLLSHHVLVPAMTGRGKSNLVKVMLWGVLGLKKGSFGCLVLDPHDEYYGKHGKGLKDHSLADELLVYYSPVVIPKGKELAISLDSIRPSHFEGIVSFSEEERDFIKRFYGQTGRNWISNIIRDNYDAPERRLFSSVKRKLETLLGIYLGQDNEIQCHSQVFKQENGLNTVQDIIDDLLAGKMVIIDTIRLIDEAELLIGSIITNTVFERYLCSRAEGSIEELPTIAIVLEEAPRALAGETIRTKGESIYSLIAREGRKFKIGLVAITQLTSIIPKPILTNLSTKIILGNELKSETETLIESSSQDLSSEQHNIGSLDIGEAIITSIFTKFAVPIKIPYFDDYIKE